jgi:glycosyltransferase involved in cell wall biosynthesis
VSRAVNSSEKSAELGKDLVRDFVQMNGLGSSFHALTQEDFCPNQKLMNYMAHGIPELVSVNPRSARIVQESGGGWVTDAAHPGAFAAKASEVLRDHRALHNAGQAGHAYAQANFAPARVAESFERVLEAAVSPGARQTLSGSNPARANSRSPWRHSRLGP